MARDNFHSWMWSEAVAVLTRAEHLHQQFFRPATHDIAWEPPVDVLELDDMVLIIVALPGIDADQVETVIEDSSLRVSGRREHGDLRVAVIHRLNSRRAASNAGYRAAGRYAAGPSDAANDARQPSQDCVTRRQGCPTTLQCAATPTKNPQRAASGRERTTEALIIVPVRAR
jgi:hypothetical protein